MKRIKEKTKTSISITLDRNLKEIIKKEITNHSKYIEWVIYQDLLKNFDNEEIKKIII